MRKVMITVPEEFLVEMDRVAKQEHRNRSELVREAVRRYIAAAQERAESRQETLRYALRVQEMARSKTRDTSFDSTRFIREWREQSSRDEQ